MKHYLDLIPLSSKIHRKNSRMTRICIFLAVFLVTVIFGMADMEIQSQRIRLIADSGNWHIMLKNITPEDAALIAVRPEVVAFSPYNVLNYRLNEAYYLNDKSTVICGFNPNFLEDIMTSTTISEGSYPATDQQIMVTENAKNIFHVSLRDTITLNLPNQTSKTFEITGFIENPSMITKKDAIGTFVRMDTFSSLMKEQKEQSFHQDLCYYVQFSEHSNIQKNIQSIKTEFNLTDKNLSINNPLLATLGQSQDPLFLQLYSAAFVLFLLVLTAGIFMIAGSLNSNIAQKIEFFGMMRCLGATSKQVKRFVLLEALQWCKSAIPLGLFIGSAIVWLLCGLLRYLSPTYFGTMPVFHISFIGIIFGIAVGVLTVLIAARSPAKRASRVSPLTAVSGNASSMRPIHKAANTKLLKVDTALGFHHAKTSKKNFFLMTGSFSLSIILFLSFSASIDFMNHAITPLKPYSPDISIISPNNTCSIDSYYLTELQKNPAVKRVYGRMFAYNLPVETSGHTKKITLISYEKHQFQWAKDTLIKGNIENIKKYDHFVLTVYDSETSLDLGNKLLLPSSIPTEEPTELTVAGVLSTCPFQKEKDTEIIICSENTFQKLTGKNAYTILDLQLTKKASDSDVLAIQQLFDSTYTFSDQRKSNAEALGAYLSFALFLYGFLIIIALITVFNIINSISLSVASRLKQYGAMRAIGMSNHQLYKMIKAEAITYSVSGCFFGCILGLPIHRFLFNHLVTYRWGDTWHLPFGILSTIIIFVLITSFIAVKIPLKQIHRMSIVDTINAQ